MKGVVIAGYYDCRCPLINALINKSFSWNDLLFETILLVRPWDDIIFGLMLPE